PRSTVFPYTTLFRSYVNVALLLPHQQRDSDAPMRLYGIVPLLVEDPATRLQPEIQVLDEVRPETEFTVTVSEKDQRAMTYTLARSEEHTSELQSREN